MKFKAKGQTFNSTEYASIEEFEARYPNSALAFLNLSLKTFQARAVTQALAVGADPHEVIKSFKLPQAGKRTKIKAPKLEEMNKEQLLAMQARLMALLQDADAEQNVKTTKPAGK